MRHILLIFGLAGGLATGPAFAADKDHCAEMMEHNKAPGGGGATEAAKKGCGMAMGEKKGLQGDRPGKAKDKAKDKAKAKGKEKAGEHAGHE